jgi:hypothetical protein
MKIFSAQPGMLDKVVVERMLDCRDLPFLARAGRLWKPEPALSSSS